MVKKSHCGVNYTYFDEIADLVKLQKKIRKIVTISKAKDKFRTFPDFRGLTGNL